MESLSIKLDTGSLKLIIRNRSSEWVGRLPSYEKTNLGIYLDTKDEAVEHAVLGSTARPSFCGRAAQHQRPQPQQPPRPLFFYAVATTETDVKGKISRLQCYV